MTAPPRAALAAAEEPIGVVCGVCRTAVLGSKHPVCMKIGCPGATEKWVAFTRAERLVPDKCSHPAFTGPIVDFGEGSVPTCILCGASEDEVKP